MQTLEALRRSLGSTRDLVAVVRTMKTLAAVNIRQYEQAALSLQSYTGVVEQGFQIALRRRPVALFERAQRSPERTGAVVFGSDTGLCGRFNQQIVDFAAAQLPPATDAREHPRILALGLRAANGLEARGLHPEQVLNLPNTPATLTHSVQELLHRLETWVEQGSERLVLFHNRLDGGGRYAATALQIHPFDTDWLHRLGNRPWISRSLPTYRMDWDELFAALVREYLFVSCYRALAESLASENAARLAAMQAAEENIVERLAALRLELNQVRQSAITEELQDIVAGAEVLSAPRT
jgi:F-type H+-transporting ATPase subunit gamma